MFGYIVANKKALSDEQKARYQSVYCGLCQALRETYGQRARMTLSYDMAFLILAVNALYELPEKESAGRCMVHPIKPRGRSESQVTSYAADLSVLLGYEKLLDDLLDENSALARAGEKHLREAYALACQRLGQKGESIKSKLQSFYAAEKARADVDTLANSFGEVMGEVFSYRDDRWGQELSELGRALGRFIYVMDAYVDFEEDQKWGRFNPLESAADESILQVLMGEAADIFERLPIVQDTELLRHVIYSGVWLKYDMKKKRERGKANA